VKDELETGQVRQGLDKRPEGPTGLTPALFFSPKDPRGTPRRPSRLLSGIREIEIEKPLSSILNEKDIIQARKALAMGLVRILFSRPTAALIERADCSPLFLFFAKLKR
jgi:hypothetical protein